MLAEATQADAEAGFTSVALADADIAGARHLVIGLLPENQADGDPTLAGYLRVEPGGEVRFVVAPKVRSRGVATLLFERLGPEGWAATGEPVLAGWARGDHPAAQRLARRFDLNRTLREWQLVAPLRAPDPSAMWLSGHPVAVKPHCSQGSDADGGADGGDVLVVEVDGQRVGHVAMDVDAAVATEYGPAGRITDLVVKPEHTEGPVRAELLRVAMQHLLDSGRRVAAIVVDSRDTALLREARLLGFAHDRTDSRYELVTKP